MTEPWTMPVLYVNRYECPLKDCDWQHDEDRSATTREELRAYVIRTENAIRAHMETHTLLEWTEAAVELAAVTAERDHLARRQAGAVADVLAERARQNAKWGEQNHPDGTSGHNFRRTAANARQACQEAARGGYLTWFHVAREEFFEAMAETDEDKLRAELVQNAAVFLAWIECIDRRKAGRG